MTRTKKLQPVVQHVDQKEQTALQAVAASQRQLELQQTRLTQLREYKTEYTDRHLQPQSIIYTAFQFQEYNRFLTQLDETIQRQEQVMQMALREVEIKRQKWKLSHSRSEAMHKVVDRIQATEFQQAEKLEQKLMDEVALRNLHNKSV
ncbi:MAG: flagellar export protein FliJ [Gammaproteobacteria bacterium]|nr:flagellar export protein FliJ [Gammaproteobacteria bacterium]MBL6998268.1 flagellar export protein FliJ [Gammaproteobacteria bacterium]